MIHKSQTAVPLLSSPRPCKRLSEETVRPKRITEPSIHAARSVKSNWASVDDSHFLRQSERVVQAAQILAIATSNHTNNVSNASLSNRKKHRNNFANIEGRRASIEELRQRATIKHKKDSHAYGERWIARCCGESIYQNKQYIQLWGEETGKKPQTWDQLATA